MAKTTNPRKPTKEIYSTSNNQSGQRSSEHKPPPSWAMMKSILTCKHLQVEQQPQQPQQRKQKHQKQKQEEENSNSNSNSTSKKMRCSGSLCNNTKVMQRPTAEHASPELFFYRRKAPSSSSSSMSNTVNNQHGSNRSLGGISTFNSSCSPMLSKNSQNTPARSGGGSSKAMVGGGSGGAFKGIPFRRLSGCYECRMVVDPVLGFTRDPSLRAAIRSCPQCGEIFMKPDYLELHQAIRHAVSELGPEDTSKNIVEIIFQSSWLKKQAPVCKIDRILKVHSTNRTVSRFEEYRDSIKAKATGLQKKHPRCIADGNELLRFHCTTLVCSLGLDGSSNLCNSIPQCNVCSIIRDGFKSGSGSRNPVQGILTTATSGRAHDRAEVGTGNQRRAMLVCRVIAGRVKKAAIDGSGPAEAEYDSVAGPGGVYSNLDELYVYNPRAILPCFVVIYSGF